MAFAHQAPKFESDEDLERANVPDGR